MISFNFLVFLVWLSYWIIPSFAIYFYLDPGQKMFFVEHLRNYTTLVLDDVSKNYVFDPTAQMQIMIKTDSGILMNQLASPNGRFFFTSTESALHSIILSVVHSEWNGKRSKVTTSFFIGEPGESAIVPPVKASLNGMALSVSELMGLIGDIRHDQVIHRQRQAEFHEQSENLFTSLNYWMLVQICVLLAACYWQMNHLKRFFLSKKLV